MSRKLFKDIGKLGFGQLYRYLIMVLLLNFPILFVVLALDQHRADFTFLTWFYIITVIIGYYVLPLLTVATILWLLFGYFRRIFINLLGAFTTIYIFYFIIDYLVYKVTRLHIDLFWLEWIFNDFEAFGLPGSTIRNIILLFLFLSVGQYFLLRLANRLPKPRFLVTIFVSIVILSFAASQAIHAVAYQRSYTRITSLTPNFPVYVPVTSHRNAKRYGDLLPMFGDEAEVDPAEYTGSLFYPSREIICHPPADSALPNILFLLFESWRFDAMDEKITPNTYALGEKSSVFSNHFCSGNSTIAGTFGLFYGIHPTYWPAVKANAPLIDDPVLIDVLKENHYDFGIFAKSNFERHKIKDAVFRGIEIHKDFAGPTLMEQDVDMVRQLNEYLGNRADSSNPFMAMAFFKSNHFPYRYPPEDTIFRPTSDLQLMFTDDNTDPTPFFNDYLNSTHYVDRLVGEIIDRVDSLGMLENTIIVITTDHAEEFNDNRRNFWGHGTNFTKYQTMVPFVVYFPGREPRKIDYPTSHIDLVPTLLEEYFGCVNDITDYSNGRNLFDPPDSIRPFVIGSYVNHAFVIGDDVFEIYPMYTRKYKLYDMKVEADPPPASVMKEILDEINRFYREDSGQPADSK